MAASKENLLSLVHLTGTNTDTFNTFANHRQQSLKKRSAALQNDFIHLRNPHVRVMHLHQRLQKLRDRERAAQHYNRQLLQQFEEAQETLRMMMVQTAAMKTIRMEYERYLEESAPHWQRQLKGKKQAAQRTVQNASFHTMQRVEDYLETCLKNTEEHVTKSLGEQPSLLRGSTTKPQTVAARQSNSRDGDSLPSYIRSSWLTNTAPFPLQPDSSSQIPQSLFPLGLPHLWQNPSAWVSGQPDYPSSWMSGAAGEASDNEVQISHRCMEEAPPERGVLEAEGVDRSTTSSSSRGNGGGHRRTHLSQELDTKPVRLSSGCAESSESDRDSIQAREEKKKKKSGRPPSSERERCSSQESSRTSSTIVIAVAAGVQTSQSETSSSEKDSSSSRRMRRKIRGPAVESPKMEQTTKERSRSEGDERESLSQESQSTSEDSERLMDESRGGDEASPLNKSEKKDESGLSGSDDEEQETNSSEGSSAGEKVVEEKEYKEEQGGEDEEDGSDEEKEQTDESQKERDVEEDVSAAKTTTEEEEMVEESDEEQEDDEEQIDKVEESRKQDSSHDEEVDEEVSEGSEDEVEEGGSDEEEDDSGAEKSDKAGEPEEEEDSEDGIIAPRSRPSKMPVIPEVQSEEEGMDGSRTSDEESNEFGDEDIEHLLAPPAQTQEENLRSEEKAKATGSNMKIFQVEPNRPTNNDAQSDADDFDHFYD